MIQPRTLDVARIAAAFALALLLAMLLPFTARAAEGAGEAKGLGGYTGTASAAPMSMLMYEPVFPVPVDPGEPSGEGSLSYTSSKLETGPSTRAVASSVWPGPALGDGFATVCECDQEWFVKAEARNPGGEKEAEQQIPELGAGMKATADDLLAVARAGSGESPNPQGLAFGNVHSRSASTVEKGVVIATTVSSAEDVKLAAGVITIESVETTMKATSDGKKAMSEGQTKVNGLVIAGQGYVIDEKGLRPVADEKPDDSPLPAPGDQKPPGAEELRKNLGIEVQLVAHEQTKAGADVSRQAAGLRVSVNTAVLKEKLPLYDVIPPDIAGRIAPLLVLGPQIDYVLGRGAVRAAATPPLSIDLPALGPAAPPPPPASGGGLSSAGPGLADTPAGDAALPEIASADAGPGVGPVDAPLAAGEQPQAASAQLPALFGGLPPGLVAAGMVMAALGGRALAGFSGAAMGGTGGAFCDQGAPRRVPNLRGSGTRRG